MISDLAMSLALVLPPLAFGLLLVTALGFFDFVGIALSLRVGDISRQWRNLTMPSRATRQRRYTVRIGIPDPRFGNMLLEQFGGANNPGQRSVRSGNPPRQIAQA
jgi:hypothetical protein